ncbi:hypothetical protein CC99x_005900 [Candidatus Berkiella cookevillensis]|uniref:Periplasmic protein n=1 Tax=Candidatus Berkiella cookevillensis TaxID=437022 RepID=A0A0Q9YQK9_9GAMM|nr:hypothetical protein [Candidatus Berkiella cookevillensis]MCS5708437.1 hypothetical protein [Candidatus Berkiella cookevillensis]
MKSIPVLLSTALLTVSLSVFAGHHEKCEKKHGFMAEYFQNLSDEERAELKATKEKMKQLSHKERKAFRADVKNKWSELPKAEQDAFIAKNQEKIDKILDLRKEELVLRLYGMDLLKDKQ